MQTKVSIRLARNLRDAYGSFLRYVNSAKVSNNVNYNGSNPAGNKPEGGSNVLLGFGAESTIPSELFTIMKENSFFLLELNSYNGGTS